MRIKLPSRDRFIIGHALTALQQLPDDSVHCVVTSPPYFRQRDYGLDPLEWEDGWTGELGQEPTLEGYIAHLVEIFREVKRVLRPDGTMWLNLGDKWAGGGLAGKGETKKRHRAFSKVKDQSHYPDPAPIKGFTSKQLLGVPHRTAFALQNDGWFLRIDNVWNKSSAMPESVKDRTTLSHEYLFLLTKNPHYYYDHVAIKEPLADGTVARAERRMKLIARTGKGTIGKRVNAEEQGFSDAGMASGKSGGGILTNGRNKRSVWTVSNAGFKGAHFAVFPPNLIIDPIKAGTSEKGCCPQCGTPWERVTRKTRTFHSGSGKAGNAPKGKHEGAQQTLSGEYDIRMGPHVSEETLGWFPMCDCGIERTIPCTVLDPFCGSGTVGVVANKLGRNFILIDAKEEYIKMALERIRESS